MRSRSILVILFAISGATGLVYESIWTQYLGLFLGHSAYAQSLVLMLFMGGLSVGAHLVGQYTNSLNDPLRAYAILEALIGLSALIFHWLYLGSTEFFFEKWLPQIDSSGLIAISQWLVAALLVFPQTILLGATFPLMVAGLDRRSDESTGHSTAGVYFFNSLGAAIGVLIAGFYLAPEFGLHVTMIFAGTVNLFLAVIAFLLSGTTAISRHKSSVELKGSAALFLLVAAVTGSASFIYEIGWIRMLSLVLGSSAHAFELMLSAFIAGLAIGGYVIRRKIKSLINPTRTLAYVQLVMGVFAAMSIVFYDQTFSVMQFFISALSQNNSGYVLFNLLCHGLTFVFMLPVTICAGMTLPLLTQSMVNNGHGEASIARVYSANTLGSLLGVLLALHLLMPVLGLKSLIMIGALADILLGIVLLAKIPVYSRRDWSGVLVVGLIWMSIAVFIQLDPIKMASGVYLRGSINTAREIVFHRDGKTASVDVIKNGDYLAIATNGKVDAAINSVRPGKDEPTMVLIAALPFAVKPDIKSAAVIGFGSGITSHTLLAAKQLKSLDTIEIEPAMVEGARYFGERVSRVFDDPRSHIVIDDAKTFFATGKKKYDLIISEPSNPWISGIAGLFSKEHYQVVNRHLAEGGLFLQWLQIYGMNVETVASVMKALEKTFPRYTIYAMNNTDLAILAIKGADVPAPSGAIFANTNFNNALKKVGIETVADIKHRRIGSQRLLGPYFRSFTVAANSDFHGVLAPAAVKARYLGEDALELQRFRLVPAPLSRILDDNPWPVNPEQLSSNLHLHTADLARNALAVRDWILLGEKSENMLKDVKWALILVDSVSRENICDLSTSASLMESLQIIAGSTLPFLMQEDSNAIWAKFSAASCIQSQAGNWLEFFSLLSLGKYTLASEKAETLIHVNPSWKNNIDMYRLISDYQLDEDNFSQSIHLSPISSSELRLLKAILIENEGGSVPEKEQIRTSIN